MQVGVTADGRNSRFKQASSSHRLSDDAGAGGFAFCCEHRSADGDMLVGLLLGCSLRSMRKRSLFSAGLAVVGLSVMLNGSQHESTERAIRLRFSDAADLSGLSIQYFLVGPFGGFGSFVRTRPDVTVFIGTWRSQQASTLQPSSTVAVTARCC